MREYRKLFLFNVLRLFGLAPITLSNNLLPISVKDGPFVVSRRGTIYNIGSSLAFGCILLWYALNYDDQQFSTKIRRYTVPAINLFFLYYSFLIVFVTQLKLAWNRARLVKLGNKMAALDRTISRLAFNYKENFVVNPQKYIVLFTLTIWALICCSGPFCNNPIFETIFIYVFNMVASIIVLEYVCVIVLVNGMTKCLNSIILSMADYNLTNFGQIDNVRDCYLKLNDCTSEFTEVFSLPMLGCIFKSFILLVTQTYYILRPAVAGKKIINTINDVDSLFWIAKEIGTLLIITSQITETKIEMHKIGNSVHVLMRKTDGEIRKRLKEFSWHLMHKDVNFMVMNMFSMDNSLTMSIIGSMTTYLVILLQFQKESGRHN